MSSLHAHLVFVTKYRRPVFTDTMLTFCEHTMPAVCTEREVELVEFNGEADHVHLLVSYASDFRSGPTNASKTPRPRIS